MVSIKIKIQLLHTQIWAERCAVGVFEITMFPVSATKLSTMIVSGGVTSNLTFMLFLYFAESLILM